MGLFPSVEYEGVGLNKTSGKSSGVTAHHVGAVHEILTLGRQRGNHKALNVFGAVFDNFHKACQRLM